jgi:methionine synthase II (cobalamin-independent)
VSGLATARTDVVGSLLRPARWKEARLRLDSGLMDRESFARLELDCVRKNLELQEGAGLDVVTDGEISRLNFQDSFGLSVSGYDSGPGTPVIHRRPVRQRLQLTRNVPLEEYLRAAPLAKRPVKVTLIGPDRVAQRFDHERSRDVYSGMDDFVQDVVAIQRAMVNQLIDAGCRYVHIDAPGYTAYVDEPSLAAMRARGEDPWRNFARSLKADAALVAGFPGVTFGIHLCRGNQRSMWHREGSYDAIAERLFNELPHQRFLLEYDSPRAGSFAPLRFVPRDKIVVLGLVSTKVARLEPVEELKRRIDQAAKFVPLANLALSPQCGFGSDVVGNLVSEDDQKRKLERVVETARQVWR